MNWEEKRKTELESLLVSVENKFSVKRDELISKSRKKVLVSARRYFMNIAFEVFESDNMRQSDISIFFIRDRTSFWHNRKEHLNEYKQYKNYKKDYDNFKNDYKSSL